MYDFQRDLQMLNVGDFYANAPIPWDPNQVPMDRQFGLFGFGSCFGLGFGSCFGFGCFGSCFGFRCGGFGHCGGCGRCGGCGHCGRCR